MSDKSSTSNSQGASFRGVSLGEITKQVQAKREEERRKITLADVVATKPQEPESETHLMKEVEKMKGIDFGTDHETDRLYRDIAANSIFRSTPVLDNKHEHSNGNDESEADTGSPQKMDYTPAKNKKPGVGKARFRNLVQQQINQKNADTSVEHTLLALTKAMGQDSDVSREDREDDRNKDLLKKAASAFRGHVRSKSCESTNFQDLEAQASSTLENEDTQHSESGSDSDNRTKRSYRKKKHILEENWDNVSEFLDSRKENATSYLRKAIMYIMLPSLGIAAFLFYVVENPSLCEEKVPLEEGAEMEYVPVLDVNGTVVGNTTVPPEEDRIVEFTCPGLGASASWWFLFLGARQVITFTLACMTQVILVDYLSLASRFMLTFFGPVVTLFLVQAKGWPFIAVFWAVYDLILLAGERDYAHHWLYWQDYIGLFNAENPSGHVVDNEWNYRILRLTIFVGIAVAVKRLIVALFLGRQTFAAHGEKLAEVMQNMVMIGEIASLAQEIEHYSDDYVNAENGGTMSLENMLESKNGTSADDDDDTKPAMNAAQAATAFIAGRGHTEKEPDMSSSSRPGISRRNLGDSEENVFSNSQQMQLANLLDRWEEPRTAESKAEKGISIGAVLQFRQSMAFMRVRFPFRPAFGLADTRENCIESAQVVYDRLHLRTPNAATLPFETLALLAKQRDGSIDHEKAKQLIKVFRPDRQGNLSRLDFVKSCDEVYKSIKMLNANISNSAQIEKAVEGLFNTVFYIILGALTLALLGVDPMQVFLSFSSVILAFAFMFGSSSSKYFEGIMFILLQRPYGVGDRIHLSRPEQDTNINGAGGWIVEKVTLYTTSLYWVATNERATLANGAISNMKVINANRSPNAQVFVNMKFPIDTPYEKCEIFKAAVEKFLKDRPREWLAFVGFRPTEVEVERGYINYLTIAQHRSGWQDLGPILGSRAELTTYELEIAKALEMEYTQPHLPVDINIGGRNGQVNGTDMQISSAETGSTDSQELTPANIHDLLY